jgi:hypothetical protein
VFLKDMASVGTSVHTLDWSEFGSAATVEAKIRAAIASSPHVPPIPTWAAGTAEALQKLDARGLVDELVGKALPEGRIDTFAEEDASASLEASLHRRESEALSEDSPPEKRKMGVTAGGHNSAGSPEQIPETPIATDFGTELRGRNLFGDVDDVVAVAPVI